MPKGKFIVFEGINGCGKGTQIKKLSGHIFDENKGNTLFLTREPTNFSSHGKSAREMLAKDGNPYTNQIEALHYFYLDRRDHNNIFAPLINQGINVISDRYYHSTGAFQHAQGIPYGTIFALNKKLNIKTPDLTFLIDTPVEIVFERLEKRDGDKRRKFDGNHEFMEKVRKNYLDLPKILPEIIDDNSIAVINGAGTPEEVFDRILTEYKKRFP